MLNIEEEFLSLELDLEVSFCLSSFYNDLETVVFLRKLRLTEEQEGGLTYKQQLYFPESISHDVVTLLKMSFL